MHACNVASALSLLPLLPPPLYPLPPSPRSQFDFSFPRRTIFRRDQRASSPPLPRAILFPDELAKIPLLEFLYIRPPSPFRPCCALPLPLPPFCEPVCDTKKGRWEKKNVPSLSPLHSFNCDVRRDKEADNGDRCRVAIREASRHLSVFDFPFSSLRFLRFFFFCHACFEFEFLRETKHWFLSRIKFSICIFINLPFEFF